MDFDTKYWQKAVQRPDWYVEFNKFAKRAQLTTKSEEEAQKKLNKKIRRFFEKALQNNRVCLGESGKDYDRERQKFDTLVIHHTSAKPGYRLPFLNTVQLLNIYVPAYASDNKSQPIWSGHFYKGKQVFWGYHWLMRMDGSFERLLDDGRIGWHAGNWDINKRSVGICLDNDYETRNPRRQVLRQLAKFINQNYPDIQLNNIIGHREARRGTICPGNNFLNKWKPELLEYLSNDA